MSTSRTSYHKPCTSEIRNIDILAIYFAKLRALELTGSTSLFGMFGFGYLQTQTQTCLMICSTRFAHSLHQRLCVWGRTNIAVSNTCAKSGALERTRTSPLVWVFMRCAWKWQGPVSLARSRDCKLSWCGHRSAQSTAQIIPTSLNMISMCVTNVEKNVFLI